MRKMKVAKRRTRRDGIFSGPDSLKSGVEMANMKEFARLKQQISSLLSRLDKQLKSAWGLYGASTPRVIAKGNTELNKFKEMVNTDLLRLAMGLKACL